MKALFIALLLNSTTVFAQVAALDYGQLLEQSGRQMQGRDFCAATATFEQAFAPDSARANEFELFGAATAAAG